MRKVFDGPLAPYPQKMLWWSPENNLLEQTTFLESAVRELKNRDAYGANYERLVALKNKYDPTNLFRCNQNIAPSI